MSAANPIGYNGGLLHLVVGVIEGAPKIFFYTSLTTIVGGQTGANSGGTFDTTATTGILGTGYFSDGGNRGMKVGDVVFVKTDYASDPSSTTRTIVTHIAYVSAISGVAATLTALGGTT